jgi:peptidoglycan hydrolase CwlO-like protein
MLAAAQEELEAMTAHATGLQEALDQANARIDELEATSDEQEAPAPAGDSELRALATTIRTAQKNGHPDVPKHVEALLKALGA